TAGGAGHGVLLAATGIVTAVPLICFGAAAIRVPLSTLGLLQYLAPVFQFALGIVYFHEEMPPERWAGFALVWLALSLLTWDALRNARRNRTLAAKLLATAAAGAATATAAGTATPTAVSSAPAEADADADRTEIGSGATP
ncbi:EamA family transporter RarD, partial [Streptomyces sp. MBT57]|nr:EamA family transporter RarD [Streptomyces sp. MBT57]